MTIGWGMKVSGSIRLNALERSADPKAMQRIGEAAVGVIVTETQDKGISQDARRFRRYSKLYASAKEAAYGGFPDYKRFPNLTATSHMMNAVSVTRVASDSVTIGFLDTQQPDRRSLLERAWPKLSASERNAFWAIAASAKRRAGGGRKRGRRRNPSTERGRRQGPIPSGHPSPLPSEKMQFTNKLRPWFGFGKPGSKRRRLIQQIGAEIYLEQLTRRGGADS